MRKKGGFDSEESATAVNLSEIPRVANDESGEAVQGGDREGERVDDESEEATKVLFNADGGLPDGAVVMVGLYFSCFRSEIYLAAREEDNCAPRGGSWGRFERGSRVAEKFVEFLVSALAGLAAVEVATMAAGTTESGGVVAHCTVRER